MYNFAKTQLISPDKAYSGNVNKRYGACRALLKIAAWSAFVRHDCQNWGNCCSFEPARLIDRHLFVRDHPSWIRSESTDCRPKQPAAVSLWVPSKGRQHGI
jgi:hypothetical protein